MNASARFVATIMMAACVFQIKAQKNNIWCFGDSAGIDFNNSAAPLLFNSAVVSRGSCASICDSLGDLLFYTSYNPQILIAGTQGGEVYTKNHQLMANGDNLKYGGWYKESLILPAPATPSLYYIIHIGVTDYYGLYYSIIDISQNNGMGAVIQKNVQLNNYQANDGLTAIKHGNGRDWWVVFRRWDSVNNDYYKYLVTPAGIQGPFLQNIGTPTNNGFLRLIFNHAGNKAAIIDYRGLIELFDFDRCSGIFYNFLLVRSESPAPLPAFWSGEFSPNGRYFYISTSGDTSYLIQLDLQATNIWQSADTIWSEGSIKWAGGALKCAPDNRIYMTCAWNNGSWNYPYPDTVFNQINNYLSVIEYPDSAGQACNFQPYSFWLGNGRTYWGLPNNPDYDMPALTGSNCDTLTGIMINNHEITKPELFVTWVREWKKLFVNAQNLNGNHAVIEVYDAKGNQLYSSANTKSPMTLESDVYFTSDIYLPEISDGVYIVKLKTEREFLVKKFVVNK